MVDSVKPRIYPMTQRFDVCIRGGGIVGCTLALLLSQQRLRVALRMAPTGPRAPGVTADGHGDIRAYALNEASRRVLESVRAWPEGAADGSGHPAVTPVNRMDVRGDQGGMLTFSAEAAGELALNWIVDVPALEARLTQALQYQGHVQIFDGADEPPACPLTVVCEGKHSTTRQQWGLSYDIKSYGHHALAARLKLSTPHQGVARQWFSNGEILALLPLGGEKGDTAALVWSVPSDKVGDLCQLDAATFAAAVAEVAGLDTSQLQLTHPPQSWPLVLAQASEWVKPGLALAGDAAHAMHPLAGQGLNAGLADVARLSQVLQDREYWRELGDLKLLRRYERAQKAAFAAMGGLTDGLFMLFHTDNRFVQSLRNAGLNGVNHLSPLKTWLTRQATGSSAV